MHRTNEKARVSIIDVCRNQIILCLFPPRVKVRKRGSIYLNLEQMPTPTFTWVRRENGSGTNNLKELWQNL